MPFQQRTNTSCYLVSDTNPRFHGGSFGVWGHTSCEALNCKSFSNRLGAPFRSRRAEPSGGKPWLPGLRIRLALSDITWTSLRYRSLSLAFRYCLLLLLIHRSFRTTKNPAYFAVSRVLEILFDSLPAHLFVIQILFGDSPAIRFG